MAYRPDPSEFDRPLSVEDLKALRRKLSMLSPSHVLEAYREAHQKCRMDGDVLPRAAALQELVTAWKILKGWKRRRPPRRD
jgi:hypothetical protein